VSTESGTSLPAPQSSLTSESAPASTTQPDSSPTQEASFQSEGKTDDQRTNGTPTAPRRNGVRIARFDITGTDEVDESTIEALRRLAPNGRVLLQFSCGKDSLAAWVTLVKHGFTVVPVYKEVIPDVGFVSRCIAEYERIFQTRVWKLPYKNLFRMLYEQYGPVTRSLATEDVISAATPTEADRKRESEETMTALMRQFDCEVRIIGTKASDNLSRRVNFQVQGPYNAKERLFALTWRLKRNAPFDIIMKTEINGERVPIPGFYLWLGRSPEWMFDSEYWLTRKYYPEDYDRVLRLLPEATIRTKRFECATKPRLLKPLASIVQAKKDGYPFIL